ncbi:MAG: hypothetical protein R2795_10310 [Saprospiraceae bacterium]
MVNVCDTTSKAPIGLLSYVQQGYHRVEVGASESLFVTLGAKTGVHAFYNIFQLGLRWDVVEQTMDGQTQEAAYTTWAKIRLWLGNCCTFGETYLIEYRSDSLARKRAQGMDKRIELDGQLKCTFDYQTAGRLSIYGTPV